MADLHLHAPSPLPSTPVITKTPGHTGFEDSCETISLFLTRDDPNETVFVAGNGRLLYKSTSTKASEADERKPHTTKVCRLYGRTAQEASSRAVQLGQNPDDGLIIAEMEWLKRIGSSRIRFGNETNQQHVVDVRIDEFLKSTSGGFVHSFHLGAEPGLYVSLSEAILVCLLLRMVDCTSGNQHPTRQSSSSNVQMEDVYPTTSSRLNQLNQLSCVLQFLIYRHQ